MSEPKLIPLSRGLFAIVDAEDFERLSEHKWCATSQPGKTPYAVRRRKNREARGPKIIRLHREVMGNPPGVEVDHRNGDGLDCRKKNLRIATNHQNAQNSSKWRKRETSSKFKGVTRRSDDKKWVAQIKASGQTHYLGSFDSETAAANAYNLAAMEFFGVFARTNPVPA